MALWTRRAQRDKALVTSAVEAAMQKFMGTTGITSATPISPLTTPQSATPIASWLETLPRQRTAFDSAFGPGVPFAPGPIDLPPPGRNRPLPRLSEYAPSWNLNLTTQNYTWTQVSKLADGCDIIRRCIDIAISEVVKMDLTFRPTDQVVAKIMADQNVSHSKAAHLAREIYGPEIDRLRLLWENPYVDQGRTYSEFITEFLNNHYTFDGVPIYPHYNLGGQVMGFDIIDPRTIKVLRNNRGGTPSPDEGPAYQQVIYGFPRGEFQRSPDGVPGFVDIAAPDEFAGDQLAYFVRNRRTFTPYGFSAVETAVPLAKLYLEYLNWMQQEYANGSTSRAIALFKGVPAQQLSDMERLYNVGLSGSSAERHRVKFMGDAESILFPPSMDERFKPEFFETLSKAIGSRFGVSSAQLGIIPRSGLGGKGESEGQQDMAETVSQRPVESWMEGNFNVLSRRFYAMDENITASLTDDQDAKDDLAQAQANAQKISTAQATPNEVRDDMGMQPYESPAADKLWFFAGGVATELDSLLTSQEADNGVESGQGNQVDPSGRKAPGTKPEPQEPGSAPDGEAAKAQIAELRKFASRAVKNLEQGTWRDFEFDVIDPDLGNALNERAKVSSVSEVREMVTTAIEGCQSGENPFV